MGTKHEDNESFGNSIDVITKEGKVTLIKNTKIKSFKLIFQNSKSYKILN